jgi:hypothetical protein
MPAADTSNRFNPPGRTAETHGSLARTAAPEATGPLFGPGVFGSIVRSNREGDMRSQRHNRVIDRRAFLGNLSIAGAAAVATHSGAAHAAEPASSVRLAQAGPATPPSSIIVKAAETAY